MEGYYKTMDNVMEYAEGSSYMDPTSDWQDKIVTGKGWSYGAEFFVQRKRGNTTGMLGYTLSWTKRQFPGLNEGKVFPYKYDRRHDIKAAVVHKIGSRVELSATWVFGTGQATTLPTEVYLDADGHEVEVFESRNNFRLPSFHHLDVGATFRKQKKWGERSWVIGAYNVYNRRNPFFIYKGYGSNGNTPAFHQVSLFPFIPSVSYQFKF